ncbi:MAG: O-antigen ligase family protein [Actinomycetota bacterium]
MEPRRPRALEAGLFLLVVALPLAFFPLSEAAFVDVKLLVLAVGTLLVWWSGLAVDRRLVPPALALAVSLGLAAIFGVDRAASLVGDLRPTGLTMLACAIALVVVAPSIPDDLLDRARGWVVGAAATAALVVLVEHVAPDLLAALAEDESFRGATLGNPVLLAGFLAVAIPAALARSDEPRWRTVLVFAALGSAFALLGERSAYLLPPVAFLAAWWFVRPERRRLLLAGGVMTLALAAWIAAPELSSESEGTDPGRVAVQFGTFAAEQDRIAVWGAQTRAIIDRPLLGWGPGNEWSAFVTSATEGQIETATRYWADAHNLVIEIGVIAGLAGIAAFAWLLVRLVPRTARPRRARAWAAASAATLAAYSLYEPIDVTLTSLMLLLAGAAATETAAATEPAGGRRSRGWARAGVLAVLVTATAIAGIGLASSGLEQWGRTHFGSRWALERAWAIAPWRISAGEALAVELALDGRSGDEDAAAEARDVVDRLVDAHPRNPGIRLLAADVELLLRNFPETQAWIRRHREVFPNDDVRVPSEEPGFTTDP